MGPVQSTDSVALKGTVGGGASSTPTRLRSLVADLAAGNRKRCLVRRTAERSNLSVIDPVVVQVEAVDDDGEPVRMPRDTLRDVDRPLVLDRGYGACDREAVEGEAARSTRVAARGEGDPDWAVVGKPLDHVDQTVGLRAGHCRAVIARFHARTLVPSVVQTVDMDRVREHRAEAGGEEANLDLLVVLQLDLRNPEHG